MKADFIMRGMAHPPPPLPPHSHSPSAAPAISLAQLALGARAVVVEVRLAGPVGQRLRDLGFRSDAVVSCRRRALQGDPRVYEVAGGQICLRRSEARAVRVRPVPAS